MESATMANSQQLGFLFLLIAVLAIAETKIDDYFHLRGDLIFDENFDTLNTTIWKHKLTAAAHNSEFQYYSNRPENSYTRDGILYIRPTLAVDRFGNDSLYNGTLDLRPDGCTGRECTAVPTDGDILPPIQSARIHTSHSLSFKYGTLEVRAKMPAGDWIFPAIWLMPTDAKYGNWPRSGEIDMIEIRTNADYKCGKKDIGNKRMTAALHFGPNSTYNIWGLSYVEKTLVNSTWASDFHTFGLQWLPGVIRFYIDGRLVRTIIPPPGGFWKLGNFEVKPGGPNIWANGTDWTPFDERFHLILNVAVGGNYFPDCTNLPFAKPWRFRGKTQKRKFWEKVDEWLPTWNTETEDNAMQVDYIRVWNLDESKIQPPMNNLVLSKDASFVQRYWDNLAQWHRDWQIRQENNALGIDYTLLDYVKEYDNDD